MMDIRDELDARIRARTVVWIRTPEELRAERAILEVACSLKQPMPIRVWRSSTGFLDLIERDGYLEEVAVDEGSKDAGAALAKVLKDKERRLYLFEDLSPYLRDPRVVRLLRDVIRGLPVRSVSGGQALVVIDPTSAPRIDGVVELDFPLPDKQEVGRILDGIAEILPTELSSELKSKMADVTAAVSGLSAAKVSASVTFVLTSQGKVDLPALVKCKKDLISSGGALRWEEPDPRGMDGVGGLENLRRWLSERSGAFTEEAQAWGLPPPKGILLAGIPGSGKSLVAKAVATAWNIPLLCLDVGAVFHRYVGDSEERIRDALKVAESTAPAVLWIDEIEKAFNQDGGGDGGTSARVLGTLLTWLQEKAKGIFLIATSNNPKGLPPELTRAGRFDAIWWVDLPAEKEREQIVEIMKRKYPRAGKVETKRVARQLEGLTGAEIEAGFQSALHRAYADGKRDPTSADLLDEAKRIVPVTRSYGSKLEDLREWATTGARMASEPKVGNNGKPKLLEV